MDIEDSEKISATTSNEVEPYSPKEMEVIKAKFLNLKTPTKLYQTSHLAELRIIMNGMLDYFEQTGSFQDPKLYATLSRNMIALTSVMRKQDEGIKLNADVAMTHNEFRKIIDIEAKKIEEEETQIMEEKHEKDNKRYNRSVKDKPRKWDTAD